MLRIICSDNAENSLKTKHEIAFTDEDSFEDICEAIKSNYSNILEIRIEYSKSETMSKETFIDEKSEAVQTKDFIPTKTKPKNLGNEGDKGKEPILYHKDFSYSQYQFIEHFNLMKIRAIYHNDICEDERLYDYLIMCGLTPNTASFNIFFAAVNNCGNVKNIEALVNKLMKKHWEGKSKEITPTSIKLMLIHQYKSIDVIKRKECNIDLLSLIKLFRIMKREEIFV